jgi:hypothetical protein
MAMAPYMRRYTFRILGFGMTYAASFIASVMLMKSNHAPSGALAYLVATIPGLLVVGMIWSILRLLIECEDEYQRLLFTKTVLLATGIALSMATVWGFLETFDLAVHMPGYVVAVIWFAMIGVAGWIVRRGA